MRRRKKLEELIEINSLISTSLKQSDVLAAITLSALALLDLDSCEIWQMEPTAGKSDLVPCQLLSAAGSSDHLSHPPEVLFRAEIFKREPGEIEPVLLRGALRKAMNMRTYGTRLLARTISGGVRRNCLLTMSRKQARDFDIEDQYFFEKLAIQTGISLRNSATHRELKKRHLKSLRDHRRSKDHRLLGRSAAMRNLRQWIARFAPTKASVLLVGERGTGKGVVARLLHERSARAGGPMLSINCAGLTAELLESELFGYEKGAFTGAGERRIGIFEAAHGGTVFLDEIAELKHDLQARLLRVLQEGCVRRVGATEEVAVDVRIIAATNQAVVEDLQGALLRRDLFDRLATLVIALPALRERRDDILLLAHHFLQRYRSRLGREFILGIAPELVRILESNDWPGNVRELENYIHRLVLLQNESESELGLNPAMQALLPEAMQMGMHRVAIAPQALSFEKRIAKSSQLHETLTNDSQGTFKNPAGQSLAAARAIFEGEYLRRMLLETGGNIAQAARLAGMDRSNFKAKLRRLKIQAEEFRIKRQLDSDEK